MTVSDIIARLSSVSGVLVLGVQIGEEVIPLVKGVVSDIKAAVDPASQTVTYNMALQLGDASLDDAATIDQEDLTAINAELVRLGQQPVSIPADVPDSQPPAAS